MVSDDAAKRFMASNWLSEMDSSSRRAVLNVLVEHRAESGTVLLQPGRPNDHILFLIEGTVTVTRTGVRGNTETLASLSAPSLLGLTSFFRPTPPDFQVSATTPVWYLTLDHSSHEALRKTDPRAAEQLAVAAVHILADRLDMLDKRISDELAAHPDEDEKANEWAGFRARLFDESNI